MDQGCPRHLTKRKHLPVADYFRHDEAAAAPTIAGAATAHKHSPCQRRQARRQPRRPPGHNLTEARQPGSRAKAKNSSTYLRRRGGTPRIQKRTTSLEDSTRPCSWFSNYQTGPRAFKLGQTVEVLAFVEDEFEIDMACARGDPDRDIVVGLPGRVARKASSSASRAMPERAQKKSRGEARGRARPVRPRQHDVDSIRAAPSAQDQLKVREAARSVCSPSSCRPKENHAARGLIEVVALTTAT